MYTNFVLQYASVNQANITALKTGLLITEGDPLRIGNPYAALGDVNVATLKANGTDVLGYVNISVTDDKRPYWNAAWTSDGLDTGTPTAAAPDWLAKSQGLDFDPAIPGIEARIVDFANAQWQSLVIGQALDLKARGYSGIFLDDVGTYFGAIAMGGTPATRAAVMVDFISSIRAAVGPTFQIFLNGDPYLGTNAGKNAALLDAIDGMVLESYLRSVPEVSRTAFLAQVQTFIQPGAQVLGLEFQFANDTVLTNEARFAYEKTLDAMGIVSFTSQASINGAGTNAYSTDGVAILPATAFADVLLGNAANNIIYGLAGDDKISGYDGNDVLAGNLGNDDLLGGNGADYLYGGAGNDTLEGSNGLDVLLGEDGDDSLSDFAGTFAYLFGGSGINLMSANAAINVFNSEGSFDTMNGNQMSFYYRLSAGSAVINGSVGVDQFVGGTALSNDIFNAGGGDDFGFGGAGNDVLRGGAGNDVLIGQNGNDTLDGGAGVNLLWANDAGSDQILVNVADGGTQVVDYFEAGGTNDVVRIIGSSLTSFAGFQNLVNNLGTVQGTNLLVNVSFGSQLYLNLGANQTAIWLQGINAYSLTSADFLFG